MVFPPVGAGDGVCTGVDVCMGVGAVVGVGVGVTAVPQPASKAIKTRSDRTYLFIVFHLFERGYKRGDCVSRGW